MISKNVMKGSNAQVKVKTNVKAGPILIVKKDD